MGRRQVLYNYLLLNGVESALGQSLLCAVRTENLTMFQGKDILTFLGAALTAAREQDLFFLSQRL